MGPWSVLVLLRFSYHYILPKTAPKEGIRLRIPWGEGHWADAGNIGALILIIEFWVPLYHIPLKGSLNGSIRDL